MAAVVGEVLDFKEPWVKSFRPFLIINVCFVVAVSVRAKSVAESMAEVVVAGSVAVALTGWSAVLIEII